MVVVNYDVDHVEVFYNLQHIAIHKRSYKKDGYTTIIEHMPPDHQTFTEQFGWDADYFRREALKIGINTQQFIEKVLQARPIIQQAFEGCKGILRLANRYTPERLEAACKRALPGSRYGYNTIDNILKNNQDKLNIDEPDLFHIPTHHNNRQPDEFI